MLRTIHPQHRQLVRLQVAENRYSYCQAADVAGLLFLKEEHSDALKLSEGLFAIKQISVCFSVRVVLHFKPSLLLGGIVILFFFFFFPSLMHMKRVFIPFSNPFHFVGFAEFDSSLLSCLFFFCCAGFSVLINRFALLAIVSL